MNEMGRGGVRRVWPAWVRWRSGFVGQGKIGVALVLITGASSLLLFIIR